MGFKFKSLFKAVGAVVKVGLPLALPFLGGPIAGIAGRLLGGREPLEGGGTPPPPPRERFIEPPEVEPVDIVDEEPVDWPEFEEE